MSPQPIPPLPVSSALNTNYHSYQQHNPIMESQLKQLSAPIIGSTSTAIATTLSSSASGSSSSRHANQYSNNFWENYEHLCALQNLMPLQSLKACLSADAGTNLNIHADKLKTADWDPLLSTLRVTKSLKTITIHSNYVPTNDDPSDSARLIKGYSKIKKPPSIRNKERTNKLCRSLKDCLAISHYLNRLELFNIPLNVKDSAQIAKGLRVNKTIKLLSLDRCLIGDDGLAVICKEIQNSSNLNRVNFSSCNLTHEGANILATLIKVQALKRHNEAWKDSLRYGRPDLDSMFGIRRITINSNKLIGDKGVEALADAFKSDLWLKALDLQDCGITTIGANHLLDGLKFNAMMHVLDVRLNVDIDRDTLQKIMEQVMINSSGNNTEYEWMDLTQTAALSSNNSATTPNQISTKTKESSSNLISKKIKKRRNTNASFTKKSQFNSSTNSFKMKRCKSTGSVICNKSPTMPQTQQNKQQQSANGIPWRAAARANRYRVSTSCANRKVNGLSSSNNGYDYDDEDNEEEYDEELIDDYEDDENQDDENEFMRSESNRGQRVKKINNKLNHSYENDDLIVNKPNANRNYMVASSTFDYDKFANTKALNNNSKSNSNQLQKNQHQIQSRKLTSTESLSNNEFASNLDKIKNVSVKDLLAILQKEQESKTQLEDLLLQLQDENTKLKSQISVYKSKLEQQQQQINVLSSKQNNNSNLNRTLLDDDKALEIIELTLYKYQNFLDFLRNAGFGKLIDIGEMSQQQQQQQANKLNGKPKQKQTQFQQQQQQAELIKQQKRLNKQTMPSSSSKSPNKSRSKSPLTDTQKYYFNKINKTKNKLSKNNFNESIASYDIYNSSRLNPDVDNSLANFDGENHNMDTLLSKSLEISRFYRRFNSSSINNSTMYNQNNDYISKRNNDMLLSEIEETNKENSKINESILPSFNDLHKTSKTLLAELHNIKSNNSNNQTINNSEQKDSSSSSNKKSKKQDVTKTKSQSPEHIKNVSNLSAGDEASVDVNSVENIKQHHSTASTSPATTIIATSNKNMQTVPKIQARNSIKKNSLNESHDKEIEVEDVSEILSEEDSHFDRKSSNKGQSEHGSLKSSTEKYSKEDRLDEENDDDVDQENDDDNENDNF